MTKLERVIQTKSNKEVWEMVRNRSVYQYGITDKQQIASIVAKYVDAPADIILGYMVCNQIVCAAQFKRCMDNFSQDFHGRPISFAESVARIISG